MAFPGSGTVPAGVSSAAPELPRSLVSPGWQPGLALTFAIALAARWLSAFPAPIPDVVLALFMGILIRNWLRPGAIQAGVALTLSYFLRATIILLGAGFSAQAVIRTGGATLSLVVALVV